MTSVLIVETDPIALEMLRREIHARGSATWVASHADDAIALIREQAGDLVGLLTNIDLGSTSSGWDIARIARELAPTITIGYISAEGHRDWVAYGVPNSLLLNQSVGEAEIASAFLRFCRPPAKLADQNAPQAAGTSVHPRPARAPCSAPAPPAFDMIDWSATPLGPSAGWDDLLQSWATFTRAMNGAACLCWGEQRTILRNEAFRTRFAAMGGTPDSGFAPSGFGDWHRVSEAIGLAYGGQSGTFANLGLLDPAGTAADVNMFDISCVPIWSPSGRIAGVLCLFTDATAIRSIETIRRERDDLHALFMQTTSFIAFLEGADHRFTFANAAYLQLVERTDLIGQRVIDAFPEVVAQGFVKILDRLYLSGEPFVGKGMEIAFRTKDGGSKRTVLDFIYHPLRSATGEITGIFVEGEDMTEHHKAQARIGILQNRLIHASRVNAMGMLASTIAHELNQPLTSIHNYMAAARMILERQEHHPRVAESLQGAADAALRAGDIIRNLKSMTTKRGVLRRPVPLAETLREATTLASVGRHDAHIDFDLASTTPVHGDRVQIQQVVFNLVQNALDEAGPRARISISTADAGAFVEIHVSDSGPGIDPGLLPTIFDSFVTTKSEGTGLGLSICKAIVEGHGGTIGVRNRIEGGATFCFTLPRSG